MKGGNGSPAAWVWGLGRASMRPPFMKGGNFPLKLGHQGDRVASMRPPFMKGGNGWSSAPRCFVTLSFNEAALHEGRK